MRQIRIKNERFSQAHSSKQRAANSDDEALMAGVTNPNQP